MHSSAQRFIIRICAAFGLLLSGSVASEAHQEINPAIVKIIPPRGSACGNPPTAACIEQGRKLFETGIFGGNGRTCATCHPANNNFTIDVPYISKLPKTDPLFVFETVPALNQLETPLLRTSGLICENLDGFGNKGNDALGKRTCVLRSVIATQGLKFSTTPDGGPFDTTPPGSSPFTPARPTFPLKGALGWGGDGSPGDGSLRNFAVGAVTQHFPKTLNRVPGVDFILPTAGQLDAMEAFQLSLGRQAEMNLNPDPTAQNKSFNCDNFNPTATTGCTGAFSFELKTMPYLKANRSAAFTGVLLEFNDANVTAGQLLFFGGAPSTTGVRTCSGCHIQAGAGSPYAPNTPLNTNGTTPGNRQRATGASMSPSAPACLPGSQGIIYNADSGWGAGSSGFPFTQDPNGNYTIPSPCSATPTSNLFPLETCFKTFTTNSTLPPLSNPYVINSSTFSLLSDVGANKLSYSRQALCNSTSLPNDQVYFSGTTFFSTPSVIEAANTIPLFHNNIAQTVEDSVRFYESDAFDSSASGNHNRFRLDVNQENQIGSFLRAINALDGSRYANYYLNSALLAVTGPEKVRNVKLAIRRISDAIAVLRAGSSGNPLGGPSDLFITPPTPVSSYQAAINKLDVYGASDSALNKLSPTDINFALLQLNNACHGILTSDAAASYCP